jgi:8-oxo-dGTP diphosphatase
MVNDQIGQNFGGKLRIRVCGLCWIDGKLLMVNHSGLTAGSFWAPPGGGVEFGVGIHRTLQNEFEEETGIRIEPGRHLFTCEFLRGPLHAIELFFEGSYLAGKVRKGKDPELSDATQIITEVRLMDFDEILALKPDERHGIFSKIASLEALENLSGFHTIY